jgi:hypothetical protein
VATESWRVKCFYHQDLDAIALCSWCNRGLCPACAAEVGDRLACRGRCETAVARAIRIGEASTLMVEHSQRAHGVARLANYGLASFVLVVGVIVTALGYARRSDTLALLLLGCSLVVFGLILVVVASRWPGWSQGTGRRG